MQRHLRLRYRADFSHLRLEGKVWNHPILVMSVVRNQLPHNRYGFIVSKRLGNAVIRNRVRRRLRACVISLNAGLQVGYDFVFIPRPASLKQDYQGLCGAVDELTHQAGLWK